MQRWLKALLQEAIRLISLARANGRKTKALFKF
jgi:hypothetical protein